MTSPRILTEYNNARYVPGQKKGHYESYFLRANHPSRPLAFWIRYTIFNPHNNPGRALGELWFMFFDGETGKHAAAKQELPIGQCRFSGDSLDVAVGNATLVRGALKGAIKNDRAQASWDLSYNGAEAPLFDFPEGYYYRGFPKAKVLVGLPLAAFRGELLVNGKKIKIENWTGSENHNWGSKHTDHYAWGQVAGFENSMTTFLELATARIKIGPLWTPFMTPLVLRHAGKEYALNNLGSTLGRASFKYFDWNFKAEGDDISLQGNIRADRRDFVCLPYYNPPGGTKFCLNTKIAACRLIIKRRGIARPEVLETHHRAAFEILTDSDDHGLTPAV
jgi:hypothetical protein